MNGGWSLGFDGIDADQEGLREALCTLGNGYFATRGAWPERYADEVHYPGTYVAGVYDRATTEVAGRSVENEDLVNVPNWLVFQARFEDGPWLSLHHVEVLSYHQELDLRRGMLVRHGEIRDPLGRETFVTQRRIVHMADMHLAALQTTFSARNWSGKLVIRSALDGRVRNAGVPRYRDFESSHLRVLETGDDGDVVYLLCETKQSGVRIAEAARTTVHHNGSTDTVPRKVVGKPAFVAHDLVLDVVQGADVTIEKVVALHTSRDNGGCEPLTDARERVVRTPRFDELLDEHVLAWSHLWSRFDIDLAAAGDHAAQQTARLHLFHVLQTVSQHTVELDVGVPARGLHGEAYRGHVFWDEMFVLPLLSLRMPILARALLLYRWRRLDEARWSAAAEGLAGALYPWQSGSSGREESQRIHLNPRSGRWIDDNSRLQRHIDIAVAWNVWQYYEVTGDVQFLRYYGAEMLIEITRLLTSLTTYNRGLDRYEIRGVMGPDEYHDAYPGATEPGLDNNAYTNLMTVWVLLRAIELVELLPATDQAALYRKLRLTPEEIDRWHDISCKMLVPFHADEFGNRVISQFSGYADLQEFDWVGYGERYGDVGRLDRILEAESDSVNRYKVSKQADVLMLFYLLSDRELADLFARLRYDYDDALLRRTTEYYQRRTAHGSTLSSVVHSWVLTRLDRERSWEFFRRALDADVGDVQHGTTREGVHLGAMAATIDLLLRCYCGIEPRGHVLRFDPALPQEVEALAFQVHYRGQRLRIHVDHRSMTLTSAPALAGPITVRFRDEEHEIKPESSLEFVF